MKHWHYLHLIKCLLSLRENHFCHHPTTVLSGSRSEWLLAVSCSESGSQGNAGHQIVSNSSKIDSTRDLLWRLLRKSCRMYYHYSAMLPFREPFDRPSRNLRWLTLVPITEGVEIHERGSDCTLLDLRCLRCLLATDPEARGSIPGTTKKK
jgi:hypothetical protein